MAAATKKEGTIAEKLDALFELQKIDSEIDRIPSCLQGRRSSQLS